LTASEIVAALPSFCFRNRERCLGFSTVASAATANGGFVRRLCENWGFLMISRCSFSGVANLMVQLDQSAPKSGNFWHL
jgi:hypothetical protein